MSKSMLMLLQAPMAERSDPGEANIGIANEMTVKIVPHVARPMPQF